MIDLADYSKWLRSEIRRIERGGAHEPWLTREQSIARLRIELEKLDSTR